MSRQDDSPHPSTHTLTSSPCLRKGGLPWALRSGRGEPVMTRLPASSVHPWLRREISSACERMHEGEGGKMSVGERVESWSSESKLRADD